MPLLLLFIGIPLLEITLFIQVGGADPTEPLAHGAMILFSGALLLTPGFFTDAVGFALLIPGVRSWVFKSLRSRVNVQSFQMGPNPRQNQQNQRADNVIDGDFEEIDPNDTPQNGQSGWTKH